MVFAFERKALVLDARIEGAHLVAQPLRCDAKPEVERREEHRTVRESDLSALEGILVRLTLLVLGAARVVQPDSGRHLLVVLEVAEASAELARGGRGIGIEDPAAVGRLLRRLWRPPPSRIEMGA